MTLTGGKLEYLGINLCPILSTTNPTQTGSGSNLATAVEQSN